MLNFVKQLFGSSRAKPKRHEPTIAGIEPRDLHPRKVTAKRASTTDLLDNPSLKLEPRQDEGFDPYNTGTFNRSGSWERINRRRSG